MRYVECGVQNVVCYFECGEQCLSTIAAISC